MKPIFQKLTALPEEGFVYKEWVAPGYDCPWHLHPEYELIVVLEGSGYRVVGDNVNALAPGDMVFIGPMLPHIWHNEMRSTKPPPVRLQLLQFETRYFGDAIFALPAMTSVRRLLERSTRGLHITGETRHRVAALLAELRSLTGFARLIRFFEILGVMADSRECHPLASVNFVTQPARYDQDVMNRIFGLLNSERGHDMRLLHAARHVGMSEGAFSRFFRLHTGKTFPEFRNELRVGQACRLLTQDERNITDIAYECGFTNLSNFNRQFLRLKGVSPREFRHQMRQRLDDAYA